MYFHSALPTIAKIMPLVVGTPESTLARSDSKNPATTCRGLTSNGRPCRRSLASPKKANAGVIAVLPHVGDDVTAYFCWQHKDQASSLGDDTVQVLNLPQRSSIDTLMEKLQVSDTTTSTTAKRAAGRKSTQRISSSASCPPLATRYSSVASPVVAAAPTPHAARKMKRKEKVHVSIFCCVKSPDSDLLPPARPRPVDDPFSRVEPVPSTAHGSHQFNQKSNPYGTPLKAIPATLESKLSYIPPALLSPIRTSLMTELSRPLTVTDHEPGYIYIFWLTPKDVPVDAAKLASSLLQPPEHRPNIKSNMRRTSDVLLEFNHLGNSNHTNAPRTIMLKIGRASNVHRRMVQWSQQCGHHITLLRYYPYQKSTSPLPSPQASRSSSSRDVPTRQESPSPAQKSPLVARVERLIHLELADRRVKRNCEGCGREHREWFEVEATRSGIQEVDGTVRRWIEWAQQQKG